MITHNILQGSPEWLSLRNNHFTASEAPALMGVSTYMNRTDLLTLKKTGVANEIDEHTQRRFDKGHEVEEKARILAEEIIGEELYPVTGSIEINGLNLLSSFDGLNMMESIGFEHKLINEKNAELMRQGIIPDQHKPQMEQQLLVSGAEKILFMVSDGSKENMYYAWYESDPELRAKLLASWGQFAEDLKTFEPPKAEKAIEAKTIESLPSLFIEVKGEVTNSNLSVYKETALNFIRSINTDLVTDEDFVNADKTVKWLTGSEKKLDAAKEQILGQTATIDEAFKTIDVIKEEMREKRLFLGKQVKQQKEQRKHDIIQSATTALHNHISKINQSISPVVMPIIDADFFGAAKGKSLLSSIQDSVDTELANAKIKANDIAEVIRLNLSTLNLHAADYRFLFNDIQQIINHPSDIFASLVKARIVEHKEAERAKEEARKAAEQARIEAEKKRIEAEAQQKLEADREQIRLEEERKARAEAEQKLREEQEKANQISSKKQEVIDQKQSVSTVNSSLSKYEQLELKAAQWLRDMGVDSHVATNILAAIASGNSPFKLI